MHSAQRGGWAGIRRGHVYLARVLSCAVKPWAHRLDCAPLVRLLSLVFLAVLLGTCGALAIVLIATGLSVSSPNQLPVR